MLRIIKILIAACLLAAITLLNSVTAEAKGHASGPAKSMIRNAVQTKKTASKPTAAKAKLLTLTKKTSSQFKKARPISKPIVRNLHRRPEYSLCWDFAFNAGCYMDEYCYAQPSEVVVPAAPVVAKAAATVQEPSDDNDSDDSGDSDDSSVDGICAN